MNDMKQRIRLGYKLPRRDLLPRYMSDPYFVAGADIMDSVMQDTVDKGITALRNIRNAWITNPEVEQFIIDKELLPNDRWSTFERRVLVQQVNMLGMELASAGFISNESFQNLSRWLGIFWWERGTYAMIEFMNFCLGIDLSMEKLWSVGDNGPYEYGDFEPEGPNGTPPATPIWEGGYAFPTTHIRISALGGLLGMTPEDVGAFFYEIANYNLVIESVDSVFDVPIVADPDDEDTKIVALGIYMQQAAVVHITRN